MPKEVNNELFVCECADLSHQFILTTWDFKDGTPSLDLSIRNNIHLPFYKRVWVAIKYIFKVQSQDYDVVLLDHDNVLKLKDSLDKYLELEKSELINNYKF